MKYRIKEEYKKLFGGVIRNNESPLEEWFNCEVTQEALEPVEERVELKIHELKLEDGWTNGIYKEQEDGWTAKEIIFLEFCLNDLKSEDNLTKLVHTYLEEYDSTKDGDGVGISFKYWLKENHLQKSK